MNQSFEEFTNGKYTTPEMIESLERATRYTNLQIAIERVLCTYINETDASERLPITQIDFEHHGARVSVKVEIGEVTPIQVGCRCGRCGTCKSQTNEYDTILAESHGMTLRQFRHLMRYHPTSGKGADEIWQKREETLVCNDPLHFEKGQDESEVYNTLFEDQKKMEEQLSSTNWRANSMYTSREDQERYGNG